MSRVKQDVIKILETLTKGKEALRRDLRELGQRIKMASTGKKGQGKGSPQG